MVDVVDFLTDGKTCDLGPPQVHVILEDDDETDNMMMECFVSISSFWWKDLFPLVMEVDEESEEPVLDLQTSLSQNSSLVVSHLVATTIFFESAVWADG